MVERFSGRLSDVIGSHHCNSAEDLETTLKRYVWLYHQHLTQKALDHRTPVQAMKDWLWWSSNFGHGARWYGGCFPLVDVGR